MAGQKREASASDGSGEAKQVGGQFAKPSGIEDRLTGESSGEKDFVTRVAIGSEKPRETRDEIVGVGDAPGARAQEGIVEKGEIGVADARLAKSEAGGDGRKAIGAGRLRRIGRAPS